MKPKRHEFILISFEIDKLSQVFHTNIVLSNIAVLHGI